MRAPFLLAAFTAAASARAEEPPPIAVAGCAAVTADSCELRADRRLRIFIAGAHEPSIRGAARTKTPPRHVPGGRLFELEAPAAARELAVRTPLAEKRLTLLAPATPDPAQLTALSTTADDLRSARILDARARVALRAGDTEAARTNLHRAIALYKKIDHRFEEQTASLVLVHLLAREYRWFEAAELLEAAAARGTTAPEAEASIEYYRGFLEFYQGQIQATKLHLDRAALIAERFGIKRVFIDAEQMLAQALQMSGRHRESCELLEHASTDVEGLDGCERAQLVNNRGWGALLEREGSDQPACGEPRPILERARKLFEESCPIPYELANVHVNLALADVLAGRPRDARRELAKMRQLLPDDPQLTGWAALAEGGIALLERRVRTARDAFDRVAAVARAGLVPGLLWRAELGRARALRALGSADLANDAYLAAQAAAADEADRVPLGEGRDTSHTQLHRVAGEHIQFLLEKNRPADAMNIARRSISRMLETLRWIDALETLDPKARGEWERSIRAIAEARAALANESTLDWRLSREALEEAKRRRAAQLDAVDRAIRAALELVRSRTGGRRPIRIAEPAPGEVVLAYHAVPKGWVGFAHRAGAPVRAKLVRYDPRAGAEVWSRELLAPFAAELAGAEKIRVHPFGALEAVEFPQLPWSGGKLSDAASVVFGHDLAARTLSDQPRPKIALIVADTRGNLPAAAREGARVAERLKTAGWRTILLAGPAAKEEAVLERRRSGDVELFYFAGHGAFGGRDGWASVLLLAGAGSIRQSDILVLERAPPWVVLAACEAGRSSAEDAGSGLGLARAFLAAGSSVVIASSRPIDDRAAELLLDLPDLGDTTDLAGSVRRAQLASASGPAAGFRVLVP